MTNNSVRGEVMELQAYEPPAPVALFGSPEPGAIVERAAAVANALGPVIEDRRLYTEISGRRHVRVEGWTLLGSMLGVFPICVWSRPLEGGAGWEARVEARTLAGQLVGAAESQCSRDEDQWASKPDYALRSMATTRATSKALRLPLGFVVAMAGYEATPAEELEGLSDRKPPAAAERPRVFDMGAGKPSGGQAPPPATEPQVKAIYAIARAERGMDEAEVEAICQAQYGAMPGGLSRRQASEFIDELKSGR